MDDQGDRIARQARDLVRSTAFRMRFSSWTRRLPALAVLVGPEALLQLRHYPHTIRERVLASLVILVREGHEDAGLLLLEILRPGLGRRVGWLRGTHAEDEAWQELATCVLETARRFDPNLSRNGIARDLLHQAWQKAGPKRRRHVLRCAVEGPLTELIEEDRA